jgi:hypothetical protein
MGRAVSEKRRITLIEIVIWLLFYGGGALITAGGLYALVRFVRWAWEQ